MPCIRPLDSQLINQIAAGEVVERPASVLKELLENALDAEAKTMTITFHQAGQTLLRLEDDGTGMDKEDLHLCVKRHTTSKLSEGNLWNIKTFGFRGEALAAIASVCRLTIKSCHHSADHGWALSLEGGHITDLKPTPFFSGTCVDVQDLFFATPARLKFLRSVYQEQSHLLDVLQRFALLHPEKTLTAHYDGKQRCYPSGSQQDRLVHILGPDFLRNAFLIEASSNGYQLTGWMGVATYHRAASDQQYFFINGRCVKDKVLSVCLRVSFADVIPHGRHPVAVLFLTVPAHDLDINVHPAKTEVRFKDPIYLRQFMIGHLKKALSSQKACEKPLMRASADAQSSSLDTSLEQAFPSPRTGPLQSHSFSFAESNDLLTDVDRSASAQLFSMPRAAQQKLSLFASKGAIDLGKPLGQILNSYIVAENRQGLVLVDPHAAHERIVYEGMKQEWTLHQGPVQLYLISLKMPISPAESDLLKQHQQALAILGFCYTVTEDMCALDSVPAIFQSLEAISLFKDVISLLTQDPYETTQHLLETMRQKLMAHWSCRQSIFLGRPLSLSEIEALLRQIERTPNGAQCNHGRPVYRQISLEELGHFFNRR